METMTIQEETSRFSSTFAYTVLPLSDFEAMRNQEDIVICETCEGYFFSHFRLEHCPKCSGHKEVK